MVKQLGQVTELILSSEFAADHFPVKITFRRLGQTGAAFLLDGLQIKLCHLTFLSQVAVTVCVLGLDRDNEAKLELHLGV